MEKYFARFMGRDGRIRRWSILDDNYTGGGAIRLTLAESGIKIQEDNSEGAFIPVRSWTGRATLMDLGLARQLIAHNGHELKTEICVEPKEVEKPDGTSYVLPGWLEWTGYLTPDSRTQPYDSNWTEIDIPIRGRLATADGYYISNKRGISTLASLLREALLLCGYSDEDTLYWPGTYAMPKSSKNGVEVLAMEISRSRFANTVPDKETINGPHERHYGASANTVITEIMKLFGYTLYERGGALYACSPSETIYHAIEIGELNIISRYTSFGYYQPEEIIPEKLKVLETDEQYVNFLQGRMGVAVEVQMDREEAESLPSTDIGQFSYLGSYTRYVTDKAQRMRTLAFHNQSNYVKTYVYYHQGTESTEWLEDDITHWLNDSGGLDDSGYSAGESAKRPGMFPARVARYNQSDYDSGKLKNYDFVDGYIFNPASSEHGDLAPQINADYPLIRVRSGKEMSYRGGAFLINFDLVGRTGISMNPGSPADYGVRVFASIRVGTMYWSGMGWVTGEMKFEIPIANSEMTVLNLPASGPEDQKTIQMPYNGAAGYFVELTEAGEPIELQGEAEMTLYIDATHLTGEAQNEAYKYLFLSNVTLTYLTPDDETLKHTTGSHNPNRTLRRRIEGYDMPSEKMTLMLGSYAYDSGAALCTLSYAGKHVAEIEKVKTEARMPPEEFLLGNLKRYYGRITERREIVTTANIADDPRRPIQMDGQNWRQVAMSENYADGTRTLTIETMI